MNITFIIKNNQKGFIILFTVLIAVVIFTMGLGIYSIAFRQSILASTSQEASRSFYAADAGIECALLAEKSQAFENPQNIDCGKDTVYVDGMSSFNISIQSSGPLESCAIVTVETFPGERRILSQGFNICNQGFPSLKNPRLVERNLDVTYAIPN